MSGYCWMSYAMAWLYWLVPLLLVLFIVKMLARRNWRKVDDYYQKSWANQEQMIALLKEIRDSLKK